MKATYIPVRDRPCPLGTAQPLRPRLESRCLPKLAGTRNAAPGRSLLAAEHGTSACGPWGVYAGDEKREGMERGRQWTRRGLNREVAMMYLGQDSRELLRGFVV